MNYVINYTIEYQTVVSADSIEEASKMFEDGDFDEGIYVEGSTELVDIEKAED